MRIFSSNILHYESCSLQILNYVSPKNAAKRTVLRLKGKCVWLVDHSRQEQICENARFIIDSTVSTEKDAREMMSSRVQKKAWDALLFSFSLAFYPLIILKKNNLGREMC